MDGQNDTAKLTDWPIRTHFIPHLMGKSDILAAHVVTYNGYYEVFWVVLLGGIAVIHQRSEELCCFPLDPEPTTLHGITTQNTST
jgi:hypothetical protein